MKNNWLKLAGLFSLCIAALHIVMIFIGAAAYQYFDAGREMVQMTNEGSLVPHLITLAVAIVFAIFGLYAWSGAKIIRKMPLLYLALIIIAGIYLLRGLSFFVQILTLFNDMSDFSTKSTMFSLVSLSVGLCYLLGIILYRKIEKQAKS